MLHLKKKAFSALLSEDENFYDGLNKNYSESHPQVTITKVINKKKIQINE